MKVGILTFYACHNYGAVLQTYALQEHLKANGFDAVVIGYKPNDVVGPYYNIGWQSCKGLPFLGKVRRFVGNIYRTVIYPLKRMRGKWFNKFINFKLNICNNYENTSFSYCVIGSDQVWNKYITKNDYFYFESFKDVKSISYAASAGRGENLICEDKRALDAINSLQAISVRENTLKSKLEKYTNKEISLVIDPTLLVSPNVFDSIAVKPLYNGKYVLIYKMLPSAKIITVAKHLAKNTNHNLYEVKPYVSLKSFVTLHNEKMFESPEKFLGWFKYADFVVTTSFHGVAFSLVFRKSFYFISSDDPAENRIKSLLEQLGLTHRIISGQPMPDYSHIDYSAKDENGSSVESKLCKLQNDSNNFLMQALNAEQ